MIKQDYIFSNKIFRIRKPNESDLNIWYKWFNDPAVTKYLSRHGEVRNTKSKQRNFWKKHKDGKNGKFIYSILSSQNNRLIGTCSINTVLSLKARRGEISLVIGDKNYWSGPIYILLTKWQLNHCFFKLKLNSVFAATSSNNEVVKLTLQRIGFKKIGVLRESFYKHGKFHDSVWFDILKSEWKN